MSYEKRISNWKELVIEASINSTSASEAAAKLNIKYDTYRKYAIKYDCFIKNQSGKGLTKKRSKIPLKDIFDGKHPNYQTNKLRIRLLEENIFEHKCNNCDLTVWLGNPIPLELNHINGINTDNSLSNLELLCPNCHALTPTYRGRNKKSSPLGEMVDASDLNKLECLSGNT